ATGSAAAKDAKRIGRLAQTDKDTDEARSQAAGLDAETIRAAIRQIGSKTFYLAGDVWLDSSVDEPARKAAKKVAYLSDAYFELAKAHPEAASFFALGAKVVVKLSDS